MKKLLALVLALVMSMSLVTISNAAYSDKADIDLKEAVDVLSAVGVFEGSDGKFHIFPSSVIPAFTAGGKKRPFVLLCCGKDSFCYTFVYLLFYEFRTIQRCQILQWGTNSLGTA